jgi:hypothetical protein
VDEKAVSRFFSKVDFEGPNGCWVWKASSVKGYGQFKYKDYQRSAHKLSFEHFYGPVPDGLCVCHTCHNSLCVNPNHLKLGTDQDNVDDKVAANRQSQGAKVWAKRKSYRKNEV